MDGHSRAPSRAESMASLSSSTSTSSSFVYDPDFLMKFLLSLATSSEDVGKLLTCPLNDSDKSEQQLKLCISTIKHGLNKPQIGNAEKKFILEWIENWEIELKKRELPTFSRRVEITEELKIVENQLKFLEQTNSDADNHSISDGNESVMEDSNDTKSVAEIPLNSHENPSQEGTNTIRPNPISVIGLVDIPMFTKKLAENIDFDFEIKILGKYTQVYSKSISEKERIMEILKLNGVQFFTSAERPRVCKFVVRGLPISYGVNALAQDLTHLDFQVVSVTQMKSRKDGRLLPLFLAQLVRNSKSKNFRNLRTVNRIRVQVDAYRPPKKAVQCFKCQMFYHVAAFCHVKPRCAGCGLEHETRNCTSKPATVEEKEKRQPTCCNCGESHSANYKGCKAFPLKTQFRKSYSEVARPKPATRKKPTQAKKEVKPPPVNQKSICTANPPLITETLYELQDFSSNANDLISIIREIKQALNIESFADYTNKYKKILADIYGQKDEVSRALAFATSLEFAFANRDGATPTAANLN